MGSVAAQGLNDGTLFSSVRVLPLGEVGSVAQLNRVSKGLRPVPIRTLAALGFHFFGNTIIIVPEAPAEAADSGMRALAILAVWIWQLRRKDSHHNPSVKALGVLFELGHTLESGQLRDMNTQARPRLARSHRGRMRRSVLQASTCVQVRRSLQLCRLAAHGVLWNVHHVVPTEEVHWRSRFARDVDAAARLERGVARETAKKGLAANRQQHSLKNGRISSQCRVARKVFCLFLGSRSVRFELIEAYSTSVTPECLTAVHWKRYGRTARSSGRGTRSRTGSR